MDEDLFHQLQALQSSWRKVASTHNLQDLLRPDEHRPSQWPVWCRRACGCLLLLGSLSTAGAATWVLAIHFSPPSETAWVRALQQDWYYCSLLPLTLPVAAFAAAINWFSLKLFKHNS